MPKFENILIDHIEIGPEQSRVRKIEEDVGELAESINVNGLLQPIIVFPRDDSYVLVSGQRRLLAFKKLGLPEIPAKVIDEPDDPIKAKAMSFSENYIRRPLTRPDAIDACMAFYHRYGSMKAASEELGLPYHKVREFVRYEGLPEELKQLVDEKKVKVDDAVRARNVAELADGSVDVEKATQIAMELRPLSGEQKKQLEEKAEEMPAASTEELIEEVKKPAKIKKYTIVLGLPYAEGLAKAAKDIDKTEEDTAGVAVVDWLARGGYVV
ncbi:MAG: ParB/RepB/Spo0J family partition protein [Candidatus Brocadiales bacterium]|nr:ParB/RepB/Spo0J family partition protein [Candidatus Bathyanammoxibius sp.]